MLFTLAIFPSIVLLIYIYKMDKKEKEPKKLLWRLFLWGFFLIIPVGIIESLVDSVVESVFIEGSIFYALIEGFIVAACTEEVGKYLVLKSKTFKSPAFDCMFDGIVYAVFVSLGFASIENIAYVMDGDISVAIIRMLSSVPGHACDAVFMGYYYSKAKLCFEHGDESSYKKNKKLAVLVPIILHGIYDFLIMMEGDVVGDGLAVFATFIWIIVVITIFVKSFKLVKRASKDDEYIVKEIVEEMII